MDGKNTDDIYDLIRLTKDENISVRFIEEMPFNGKGNNYSGVKWNYKNILEHIKKEFPEIEKLNDPEYSTSFNYRIKGFKGFIGVIAAYSRSFCGTCNRLRVTPQGMMKTCLYDKGVLDIKQLLRNNKSNEEVSKELLRITGMRALNGFEAEKLASRNVFHESMAEIGG
jgi:cyclic pyranopterin phosphate synthase